MNPGTAVRRTPCCGPCGVPPSCWPMSAPWWATPMWSRPRRGCAGSTRRGPGGARLRPPHARPPAPVGCLPAAGPPAPGAVAPRRGPALHGPGRPAGHAATPLQPRAGPSASLPAVIPDARDGPGTRSGAVVGHARRGRRPWHRVCQRGPRARPQERLAHVQAAAQQIAQAQHGYREALRPPSRRAIPCGSSPPRPARAQAASGSSCVPSPMPQRPPLRRIDPSEACMVRAALRPPGAPDRAWCCAHSCTPAPAGVCRNVHGVPALVTTTGPGAAPATRAHTARSASRSRARAARRGPEGVNSWETPSYRPVHSKTTVSYHSYLFEKSLIDSIADPLYNHAHDPRSGCLLCGAIMGRRSWSADGPGRQGPSACRTRGPWHEGS